MPDRCRFRIEIKVVPGQGAGNVVADLEDLAERHDARVALIEVTEPFETPSDSPLVAGLDASTRAVVGSGSEQIGVPAWTDAHNFVGFAGSEAVVFGPGDFDTAHTPEEHIGAGRVAECAEIFIRLAEQGWRD